MKTYQVKIERNSEHRIEWANERMCGSLAECKKKIVELVKRVCEEKTNDAKYYEVSQRKLKSSIDDMLANDDPNGQVLVLGWMVLTITPINNGVNLVEGVKYIPMLRAFRSDGDWVQVWLPEQFIRLTRNGLLNHFSHQMTFKDTTFTALEQEYIVSVLLNDIDLPLNKPFVYEKHDITINVYIKTVE